MRLCRPCLLAVMLGAVGLPRTAGGQARPACPSPALDRLATIRGGWIVRWFDRLAPGKYATSMARSTIRPTAGGCGLLERFDGMRSGRRFEALILIAPAGATRSGVCGRIPSTGPFCCSPPIHKPIPFASSGVATSATGSSAFARPTWCSPLRDSPRKPSSHLTADNPGSS